MINTIEHEILRADVPMIDHFLDRARTQWRGGDPWTELAAMAWIDQLLDQRLAIAAQGESRPEQFHML